MHAKTSLHAHCVHACHCVRSLLSPVKIFFKSALAKLYSESGVEDGGGGGGGVLISGGGLEKQLQVNKHGEGW